ncbi:MAG: N-acetyltransferase [Calditrichaeota bacterium]|nr:N-acetyltransferase [Calditrichota bacterium]
MIRQATMNDIQYLLPFVNQYVQQQTDPFRSGLDFYARIPDFTLTTPNGYAPVIGVLRILNAKYAWLHLFGLEDEVIKTKKFRDFIHFQIDTAKRVGIQKIVTDAPLNDMLKDFGFCTIENSERSTVLELIETVTEFKIAVNPQNLCVRELNQTETSHPAAQDLVVRDATLADARGIWEIINYYALHGEMLPKSLVFIQQNIRNYAVVERDGTVTGCAALQVMWNDLAEVASVGIKEELRGLGMGQQLIRHIIHRAQQLQLPKIFALTRQVNFFEKMGFHKIPKETLPPKIWKDCMHCKKFMGCDEVAMIREV